MTTYKVIEGTIDLPRGFKATGISCGLKKGEGALDLGLIISEVPAVAAAVYTTNLFQAAPLKVTRENIEKEQKIQAVIVNSGNANACTGDQGIEDAKTMGSLVGDLFSIPQHYVAVASTGVIGQHLPMDLVQQGIQKLPAHLTEDSGDHFSLSIMTTDLVPKKVAVELLVDGKKVTISGTAKGSGMIHPNMATMLGFLTTDARIDGKFLYNSLKRATDETFNMITVDGDTSTNDMVLVLANGLADNQELNESHPQAEEFYAAFLYVMEELAKKIARDGEGATKLVEVKVQGAMTQEDARKVAKAVIGSNLVKTAVYGADANWGRIICAVGYSGVNIEPEKVNVSLGNQQVVEGGFPIPFSEEEATNYLKGEKVEIKIHLNQGDGAAIAWGCDLTYDYIKINASYRT